MPLHLSPHDRRLLRGDAGDGARLAMRLVVKAAEVAGASQLIDIGSAHVGSCYSSGATGLDFARRLAGSGTPVAVPTTLNVAAADLLHCTPHRRRNPGFAQIRELVDLYLMLVADELHGRPVPVLVVPGDAHASFRTGEVVTIAAGGRVTRG